MIYRGLIHFHSQYSYDSTLKIKDIVKFALKYKLNFLCLTDHNTIKGSIKLKEYVEKHNYPIEVIIGAEYKTEIGDLIALGLNKEVKNMKFIDFIKEVKEQGGLILFPHPYKGHKNINKVAEIADFIEIFNGRIGCKYNKLAEELASEYKKKTYYASDAHLYNELKNAIIEFEKSGSFLNSILNSRIDLISKDKSKYINIINSQIIKSIKKKNLRLFLSQLKSLAHQIAKRYLFRKVI